MKAAVSKPLLAAMLVAVPVGANAAPPPCQPNPYAGTQTAQRSLGAAQQVNSAVMSARYGLGTGLGGALGVAQRLLGAAQTVQMARQPPGCR